MLYRIKEIAKRLDVSDQTIRVWIRNGRVNSIRVGPKSIRISDSELNRLMGVK